MPQTAHPPLELADVWTEWRAEHPNSRIRDDAGALGVTEADLVATGCGDTVIRLAGGWVELLRGLPALGRVTMHTRNECAVLETRGVARAVAFAPRQAKVRVGTSQVCVRLDRWRHGFAVRDEHASTIRHSLQFFDEAGEATHKIFLEPESDAASFVRLVDRHRSPDQLPWLIPGATTHRAPVVAEAQVDAVRLQAAWDGLRAPEDFAAMLRRFGISRAQALRLAGPDRARAVAPASLGVILEHAARAMVPLSIFVESAGAQHVYGGTIRAVRPCPGWLAVLDREVTLYARTERLPSAWLVSRPSTDGPITSLQLFDGRGDAALIVCGRCTPGEPEDERWRRLVTALA